MDDAATAPLPTGGPPAGEAASKPAARQRKLDIKLVRGSLTNVPAQAYVLGVFDNVNPTGTARAVDAVLGGTLSQFVQDRMFGSRLGEIFILPTPRQRTLCDMVVFIGLGPLDSFRPQILELVAENLARVAATARLHNLAVVPIGTNAGLSVEESQNAFSTGFLRGLERSDPEGDFQSLIVCEIEPSRYELAAKGLRAKVADGYFNRMGIDVSLREGRVPDGTWSGGAPSRGHDGASQPANNGFLDPLYLQVSCSQDREAGCSRLEYAVLTADLGAAIERHAHLITAELQQEAGRKLSRAKKIDAELGQALAEYYLPAATRELMMHHLEQQPDRHVAIIHDRGSSIVPWEVIHFGRFCPAIMAGVSRKFIMPASRAGGRSNLPPGAKLKMLVIANPTEDLDGAETEGGAMVELFEKNNGEVKILARKEATREKIMAALSSSEYDILHYAGHADFVEESPDQSGILCADGRLTSADFTKAVFAPQLVFLNGCESGRVRERRGRPKEVSLQEALYDGLQENVSLAELILTGGVRNFIGTYWPVNDQAATKFSETFYGKLLHGEPLGLALREARHDIRSMNQRDWANYLHFGNPSYRLRRG